MENWSDKRKFWTDAGRTIIFSVCAVVLAHFYFDPQAEIDKERLLIKSNLVEEFLNKSYKLTSIVYDAGLQDSIAYDHFRNDIYDEYRNVRNRMGVFFPGKTIGDKLDSSDIVEGALYACIKDAHEIVPTPRSKVELDLIKNKWKPIRVRLKELNNEIAREALVEIKLY